MDEPVDLEALQRSIEEAICAGANQADIAPLRLGLRRLVRRAQDAERKLAIAAAALNEIAAWSDVRANNWLMANGSYSSFDEPGAVCSARQALTAIAADATPGTPA